MGNYGTAKEQKISAILETLVNCRSTEEFQKFILPNICEFFSARTAVLHYYAGNNETWRFYDPIYVNISPQFLNKFRDEFSPLDPFPLAALEKSLNEEGFAFSSDQLVDMKSFGNSKFYLNFLKPQGIYHMLVVVIMRDKEPFAFLGVHRNRSDEAFSTEDVSLANYLAPYISAVADRVYMAEELLLYKRGLDTMSAGLLNKGVLILNSDYSLVFANEYARSCLADHPYFTLVSRSVPKPIELACQSALEAEIHQSNSNFTLEMPNNQINGYVRINKNDMQPLLYVVFLSSDDFGPINPKVCEEFNLTVREIDVTKCIIEGKTNSEIAEELNISIRTVQNHLRSIYEKCNVHNRTSLSNRVLSLN